MRKRGSKKIKAHFVTSKALRLKFNQEEADQQERKLAAMEKGKRKEAEDAEHAQQIADDVLNQNFTGQMVAYKKDNLSALAIAIGVPDKGTNTELLARIEGHFEQHPDLKHNLRFSGLFNKSIHTAQRPKKDPVSAAPPMLPVPINGGQQLQVGGVPSPSHEHHFPTQTFSSHPARLAYPQHHPFAAPSSTSHHHFNQYEQYLPSDINLDVNSILIPLHSEPQASTSTIAPSNFNAFNHISTIPLDSTYNSKYI